MFYDYILNRFCKIQFVFYFYLILELRSHDTGGETQVRNPINSEGYVFGHSIDIRLRLGGILGVKGGLRVVNIVSVLTRG